MTMTMTHFHLDDVYNERTTFTGLNEGKPWFDSVLCCSMFTSFPVMPYPHAPPTYITQQHPPLRWRPIVRLSLSDLRRILELAEDEPALRQLLSAITMETEGS